MREFLPLPNDTASSAKNRTSAGMMYGLLRKLQTHYGPIANGRAITSDSTRLPGAVEPAGVRGGNGIRPMDAARTGCRRERNAVYGASQRSSRRAGGRRGVRDFPRVGLR